MTRIQTKMELASRLFQIVKTDKYKDILTLEMQKTLKNPENFQLGICFVLILMLDVSAEHTEENHATFEKLRDFYSIESRKNVRIKTKQEKDFLKFYHFYGKLCF